MVKTKTGGDFNAREFFLKFPVSLEFQIYFYQVLSNKLTIFLFHNPNEAERIRIEFMDQSFEVNFRHVFGQMVISTDISNRSKNLPTMRINSLYEGLISFTELIFGTGYLLYSYLQPCKVNLTT